MYEVRIEIQRCKMKLACLLISLLLIGAASQEEEDGEEENPCTFVGEWSEWSECSQPCGTGKLKSLPACTVDGFC